MPSIGVSIIHLGKYPGKLLSNDEMKAATFPLGKYTFIGVHGMLFLFTKILTHVLNRPSFLKGPCTNL